MTCGSPQSRPLTPVKKPEQTMFIHRTYTPDNQLGMQEWLNQFDSIRIITPFDSTLQYFVVLPGFLFGGYLAGLQLTSVAEFVGESVHKPHPKSFSDLGQDTPSPAIHPGLACEDFSKSA